MIVAIAPEMLGESLALFDLSKKVKLVNVTSLGLYGLYQIHDTSF